MTAKPDASIAAPAMTPSTAELVKWARQTCNCGSVTVCVGCRTADALEALSAQNASLERRALIAEAKCGSLTILQEAAERRAVEAEQRAEQAEFAVSRWKIEEAAWEKDAARLARIEAMARNSETGMVWSTALLSAILDGKEP